jgi:hypothetical protein
MIGYVSTECQWNSHTLVSSLSGSLRPTLPFTLVIFLHLCKLDNVSAMTTQAKARIGKSDENLMLGEDQPFLLLVIDSSVASNVHHYEQRTNNFGHH